MTIMLANGLTVTLKADILPQTYFITGTAKQVLNMHGDQ